MFSKYRSCFACGLNESNGWYHNRDPNGNMLCRKCYHKYISNPKWGPINMPRRFFFRGKSIYAKSVPRKGMCIECGKIVGVDCKKTDLHHKKYDSKNPLANTIELCISCHDKYRK